MSAFCPREICTISKSAKNYCLNILLVSSVNLTQVALTCETSFELKSR